MPKQNLQIYILKYITPVLLIAVALTHIYYAKSADLTPWKGGGFGMFCTVDSKQARYFRLYLIDEKGDKIPVQIPSKFKNEVSKLKAIPTQSGLEKLTNQISELTWIDTSYKEDKLYDIAGIEPNAKNSIKNNDEDITVRSLSKFDPPPLPQEIVAVKGIEIEFWRYKFDKENNTISARKEYSLNKARTN
ncbi:MAG: hypothetical protein AAF462_00690 [Thermodesulfobacteriota bacterium]